MSPIPAPLTAPSRVACRPRSTREAGFSLVEVLVASAILAGVMLSIMTMFVFGGQHINSGKLMTKATSIAGDTAEEFRRFSHRQAFLVLNDVGNANADKHYSWNSTTNLPNYPTDTTYRGLLDGWKADVSTALPKGEMTITVRGLSSLGTNPTETAFASSRILQIVITVRWTEHNRQRSVVYETIKA